MKRRRALVLRGADPGVKTPEGLSATDLARQGNGKYPKVLNGRY